MPRVLIAGYYGYGNTGDEAILHAMVADLRALRPHLEIAVLSGDPRRTERELDVDGVERGEPSLLADAVRSSDLVILGGGGLFQDYWQVGADAILTPRQGGLPYYVTFPLLAALLGRRSMIYGVGVGPLTTEEGRRLTRSAFQLSQAATVRDEASAELLRGLGLEAASPPQVEVVADPAFGLAPAPAPEIDAVLGRLGLAPDEPYLGVVLRPWDRQVDEEAWPREVAAALDRCRGSVPERVLFLPFQVSDAENADDPADDYADDRSVGRRVVAAMGSAERAVLLDEEVSPSVMAGLVERSRLLMAMRFHAALFALRAGVPTVNLAYDPKNRQLLERQPEGMRSQWLLPPERWTRDALAEALEAAGRSDRHPAGEELAEEARRSAVRAVELLDTPPPGRSDAEAFLHRFGLDKALAAFDLEQTVRRRGEELQAAESELAEVRAEAQQQVDELTRERNALRAETRALATRLGLLEGSAAVRIVFRFWNLLRRIFPEGSRRRRLYGLLRDLLLRPFGLRAGNGAAAGAASGMEEARDPVAELHEFEDRLARRGSDTVHVVLSGTQFLESEGQRPTQLVRQLLARGEAVVFLYWRWSRDEWVAQDRVDDGLLQLPLDVFTDAPEALARAFGGRRRLAYVEFPHPSFFELVAHLNAAGWITLYDVLDDWQEFHRVGQAIWYDEVFERHLITAADAVFAINEPLAERVRELGGERVEIVPNGLLPGIEEVRASKSLERGEITVGYFGHLTPAWFDWELVAEAARRRPGWRFYLIGYGGDGSGVDLPDTVELLGKKPQFELSAYAAHWDVALIPFRPSRLAAGADPIKTYEYLAMGLPVVATGVYPPVGGEEFVERVEGVDDFVAAIERAAASNAAEGAAERRKAFAARCTWGHRLDALLETVRQGRQGVGQKRRLFAHPEAAPEAEDA